MTALARPAHVCPQCLHAVRLHLGRGRLCMVASCWCETAVRPQKPVTPARTPSSRRKGPTHLEAMLWRRIEAAGLPLPELEYRFAPLRLFRADGAYVAEKLLIEVEGGIWAADPGRHNRAAGFEGDCRKYGLAASLGWRVIRVTERMIESGEAVELIRRALEPTVAAAQPEVPA